ncbi:hypothetical protein [Aggregatibacter aphrophilus]|uniref:Uncharacterized protein n=2 Tax=Aggregatibacter aphrophilus TaxID=732 RepID=A0A3S4QSZ5_AGGAP|nr:hypothetical protein [Aggregatibacter aphrophilus]KNE85439.1 hypothetical protein ATCC33389_0205930 [Aggregatibacter aphrophilus ATCC 33389]RDE88977.1 hypothetical protein DPW00_01360 [Aggregatibacter aphrophilus]VEF44239.1 Uncharacterised protein [Aggregatibacter aphrophilus ATCC 33389]
MKKRKNIFRCPRIFTIYNNEYRNESLAFINSLDLIIKNNLTEVTISFFSCIDIKAAAMVLLYSKLETILASSHVKIHFLFSPFYGDLQLLLKKSGFAYLLKHRKSKNNLERGQEGMPIISGVGGKFRDEIIDFIQYQIYKNKLTPEQEHILSDAIYEAINNVTLHAYPEHDACHRPWWLMCDLFENELYLVLYDQGSGIPKTFCKGNKLFDSIDWESDEAKQVLTELIDKFGLSQNISIPSIEAISTSESTAIHLAMTDDITRMTGKDEEKHGQGSKSIKKLVSSHENGTLWVFSCGGLMKYLNDDTLPELVDLPIPINGTLIQWNIKV